MTLKTLPPAQALLGNPKDLHGVLRELRGLRQTLVAGAAAGTKMNIAAMRDEDTILSAVVFDDTTWGAPVDDKANITIQSTKASGTITISGNPVADETVSVNGNTYTWKAAANVTALNHVPITAGNNTQMATDLAIAINAYESRRLASALHGDPYNTPEVEATSALGVVTVTALADGTAGNAITLAEASTNVAVSGATLSGGTATGGIKSTTNLTGKTVLVTWFDKQ